MSEWVSDLVRCGAGLTWDIYPRSDSYRIHPTNTGITWLWTRTLTFAAQLSASLTSLFIVGSLLRLNYDQIYLRLCKEPIWFIFFHFQQRNISYMSTYLARPPVVTGCQSPSWLNFHIRSISTKIVLDRKNTVLALMLSVTLLHYE